MEMNHRMKQPGTVMTFAPGGRADDLTHFIDHRETLFAIIFHSFSF
jgi:hypothetical protein